MAVSSGLCRSRWSGVMFFSYFKSPSYIDILDQGYQTYIEMLYCSRGQEGILEEEMIAETVMQKYQIAICGTGQMSRVCDFRG
jgi:hypothetical protein